MEGFIFAMPLVQIQGAAFLWSSRATLFLSDKVGMLGISDSDELWLDRLDHEIDRAPCSDKTAC